MAAEAVETRPLHPEADLKRRFRDMWKTLRWKTFRVELVNGRIAVNPVPTEEHNGIVHLLLLQLSSVIDDHDVKPEHPAAGAPLCLVTA